MPEALAFNLNFLHPLAMWALLALTGYALFLGIKAKKTRTADAETRKQLIKGQYAKRHYLFGSAVLAVMVLIWFILGMLIDSISIILLTVPVFAPWIENVTMSPACRITSTPRRASRISGYRIGATGMCVSESSPTRIR